MDRPELPKDDTLRKIPLLLRIKHFEEYSKRAGRSEYHSVAVNEMLQAYKVATSLVDDLKRLLPWFLWAFDELEFEGQNRSALPIKMVFGMDISKPPQEVCGICSLNKDLPEWELKAWVPTVEGSWKCARCERELCVQAQKEVKV